MVIIVAGRATIRHGVITNFPYMLALARYGIRGALPDLMAEVAEDHVRTHLVHPVAHRNAPGQEAAEPLIDLIRTYTR